MANPAEIGARVDERYEIQEELGKGAVGVVYAAHDHELGRDVALKFLREERALLPDARRRFMREARSAATLRHPNIVQVFDFGEWNEGLYLVMERIRGRSLRETMNHAVFDIERSLGYCRDIARALEAAHAQSIVHRDIKPSNAFVALGQRGVVVTDFGLAFKADEEGTLGRLTQEGVLGGTPYYMPPEQAKGAEIGPAADVYALGCVLFEMLCGRPPFLGELPEVLAKHMYVPPPSLDDSARVSIPPGLSDLVGQMMAKEADKRPSSSFVFTQLDRTLRELNTLLTAAVTEISSPTRSPDAEGGGLRVCCALSISDEVRVALCANGIDLVPALEEAEAQVLEYSGVADGDMSLPTVVVLDSADLSEIPRLVRSGVADAIVRPIRGADLARRLLRACQRKA